MYREFDVEELHRQYDPDIDEYDEEWDEIPTYVNGEDHFEVLAQWAVKALGYKVKESSMILERDYTEGWVNFNCGALGTEIKAKLNGNTIEEDLYQHFIVERATWSLEDDGRVVSAKEAKLVLCVRASDSSDVIMIEDHIMGQCPHLLYYDQVHKTRVRKVDITMYVKVKCADEEDKLDDVLDDAINEAVDNLSDNVYDIIRDYVEDGVDYDVYYEGDIEVKVHKHKVMDVKRMPR